MVHTLLTWQGHCRQLELRARLHGRAAWWYCARLAQLAVLCGAGAAGSRGLQGLDITSRYGQGICQAADQLCFIDKESNPFHLQHNEFAVTLRMSFYGVTKPFNGFFVGTSPELEMSLYTVCFLATPDKQPCDIQLGKARMSIVSHVWTWKGKRLIGTAYVDIP